MISKPIPVRISTQWLPRIDAAAERLGTNRSRLIAFLAQTFAEHFEKEGAAQWPPDWPELLKAMDGRRRGRRARSPSSTESRATSGTSKEDILAEVLRLVKQGTSPRAKRRQGRQAVES